MTNETPKGSVDRRNFDLYRIEGEDFVASCLVDWNTGEIREASPMVRAWVGGPIGGLTIKAKDAGWEIKLVPHVGYDGLYKETADLLRKARWK